MNNMLHFENRTIAYAIEILKRRLQNAAPKEIQLAHRSTLLDLARLSCAELAREEFRCMFFDANQKLLGFEITNIGTLRECPTYPREFAKAALRVNASYVILVHNHPSGSPKPSPHDHILTAHLCKMFAMLDIIVLDHLIVASTTVYSMADEGQMQPPTFT